MKKIIPQSWQEKFLQAQFHRVENKHCELNYIPTIYSLVCQELGKFVEMRTQQPVKIKVVENNKTDYKYRYVDCMYMYNGIGCFQLEIDEGYHQTKFQRIADKQREHELDKQLTKKLAAIDMPLMRRRLNTTKDVWKQMYDIVDEIVNFYRAHSSKWEKVDNIATVKKQKCFKVADGFIYSFKHDVLNILNHKTRKNTEFTKNGTQSNSLIYLKDGRTVWMASINDNKTTKWFNDVLDDGNIFITSNTSKKRWKKEAERDAALFKAGKMEKRYIFFKVKDEQRFQVQDKQDCTGYMYYGLYECIDFDAATNTSKWRRVSTEDLVIA